MRAMLTAVLILLVLAIGGEGALAYFTLGARFSAQTAGPSPALGQARSVSLAPTITVVAQGQAKGAPDMASLNVGVQTMASSASQAMSSNMGKMQRVVNRLKGLGIAQKDLQTQGLSVFPVRSPLPPGRSGSSSSEKIQGYRATDSLQVTVNDLAKAGAALDAAIQAGANTSSGITFGLKDASALHTAALAQAASSARARADAIAKSLGVHITGLVSASEELGNRPMPLGVGSAAPAAAASTIQPGQMSVTAQLQATYSYAR